MARPAVLRKKEFIVVQQDAIGLICTGDAHRPVQRVLARTAVRAKPGLAINQHGIPLEIALRPLGMFAGNLTALKLRRLTASLEGSIENHVITRGAISRHRRGLSRGSLYFPPS